MITIVNKDEIFVFDEIGWGNTTFEPHTTAKDIIANDFGSIRKIEFYSRHNTICMCIAIPSVREPFRWSSTGTFEYWFQNIDVDLLNSLCKIYKFCGAVKHFFICAGFKSFDVSKYPILAATILGNNYEY